MAFRLDDLVVAGEICNTRLNSVHGWLQLRDCRRPLMFELTGNCSPDLAGKRMRFEAADTPPKPKPGTQALDSAQLAWHQIGPTGTMTLLNDVRKALGQAASAEGATPIRRLYLEWYSQNGHVVLQLDDPAIEFLAADAVDDDLDEESTDEWETPDAEGNDLGFLTDDEDAADSLGFTEQEVDDPYGLFPDGFDRQFSAESCSEEFPGSTDPETQRVLRELQLMDDLMESGEGQRLSTILADPSKLPPPRDLTDEQADKLLKVLLARMAACGVALHVCEHYTPRDTYRLLCEELLPAEGFYPELRSTQWVQNFMTSEYCKACDAEIDERYEAGQREEDEAE